MKENRIKNEWQNDYFCKDTFNGPSCIVTGNGCSDRGRMRRNAGWKHKLNNVSFFYENCCCT